MQNIATKVSNGKLTITVDLNAKSTRSASGKSEVLASTRGNQSILHGDRMISFGVNVFEARTT